jgi:calmodulin
MRAFGMEPTEEQLQQTINELEGGTYEYNKGSASARIIKVGEAHNGDHVLSFGEFTALIIDMTERKKATLLAAFRESDKNGSGFIDADEFRTGLLNEDTYFGANNSSTEIDAMVREARSATLGEDDTGKIVTGLINYEQFVQNAADRDADIVGEMADRKKRAILSAFNQCDEDDEGFISALGIRTVMSSGSYKGDSFSSEEIDEMIAGVSTNEEGDFNYKEFVAILSNREAFRTFDLDGNGWITIDEFRHVMHYLRRKAMFSDEAIDTMIGEADSDGNGEIDFDEFIVMMGRAEFEEQRRSRE